MFAANLLVNAMRCTYRTLADSANGRIGLYGEMASCLESSDAQHNVVFEYGNITQWLAYDELVQLEWNVRHVDPDAYFEVYPNDSRIHLSTPSPYLCFSFLPDELTELRARKSYSRLNRFVRSYAKSIMAEHSFSGPDEFLFLSMIHYMDRPTKKEVCLANAVELTTGVDILRRLMKRGLILEATDERDARSKRLSLTDSGRAMVEVVGKQLEQIPHSVLADLSEADRRQFMQTLQYLNNYHFLNYKL